MLKQPPMQFVDRSSTIDNWGRQPNASLMMNNNSVDSSGRKRMTRRRSSSKQRATNQIAYVSIMSSGQGATSRSRSQSKPVKRRSPSVKSSKSRSKPKKFHPMRNRMAYDQSTQE